MKRLVTLMIVLASVCMASAKSVVFTLSDGTLVYYLLGGETNPIMRFVDDKVVVNADTYEFSGIKNFYISNEDDPNAIENVLAKSSIKYDGNTVVVSAAKGKTVKVFAVNGTEVKAPISTAEGYAAVDMSGLQKGTYIISVGSSSIKVQK